MNDCVHISSLIIQARPDRAEAVRQAILDRGGEVPAFDPKGKLVAVIETADEGAISAFAESLALMPGVLSASLVYHLIDDAGDPPAPAEPAGESQCL